jgi:hypothetical protein
MFDVLVCHIEPRVPLKQCRLLLSINWADPVHKEREHMCPHSNFGFPKTYIFFRVAIDVDEDMAPSDTNIDYKMTRT